LRKLKFETSPGKKLAIPPFQQIDQSWWYMTNPSCSGGIGRKVEV
jgi:hypothetical protein